MSSIYDLFAPHGRGHPGFRGPAPRVDRSIHASREIVGGVWHLHFCNPTSKTCAFSVNMYSMMIVVEQVAEATLTIVQGLVDNLLTDLPHASIS